MIRAFLFTHFLLQSVASSFVCPELDLSPSYISRSPILFRIGKMHLRGRRVKTERKQGGVVAGGLASADRHPAQGH